MMLPEKVQLGNQDMHKSSPTSPGEMNSDH